ncbi:hypothetical protein [Aureimonas sp. AU12]|uniref:hypothetical protein n=1 Tax=Aureimonas sp. AU12 TaxID=1638161 RepID=UPI000AAD5766|nr:hypothetical protein [Aureimonas sp. AU12]
MTPLEDGTALGRFEMRLREAARAHATGAANAQDMPRWLLLRYGITAIPAPLDASTRRMLTERLRIEDRRLLRAARAGRPGYDLGRHLALRRLACRLEAPEPAPTPRPPSGAELNARFARGRRRQRDRQNC